MAYLIPLLVSLQLYRHLPWFDYTVSRPMYNNMLRFESDQHIAEFRQPVLILHAEDDLVVPFDLGYKVSAPVYSRFLPRY